MDSELPAPPIVHGTRCTAVGCIRNPQSHPHTGGWFRSLLALDVAGMPRTMRMEYPGAIYHVMRKLSVCDRAAIWPQNFPRS